MNTDHNNRQGSIDTLRANKGSITPEALAKELSANITGEVRFDDGSRALYSTDSSNYRQLPIGVVLPHSEQDIINTVALCAKYGVAILSRGGGTSLAGQCCNVAVVMDMSKYYNRVIHVDPERKLAKLQPGIVLDHFRKPLQKQTGLTFGPDPATHDHCTIGGMLGNNSCGVHSVMAAFKGDGARTSDNVDRMTVLTYDGLKLDVGPTSEQELQSIIDAGGRQGEIYSQLRDLRDQYADLIRQRFPKIPRRVSGYNLPELLPENNFNLARALVGTESTCVTILDATLKLVVHPVARSLVVIGFHDLYEGCKLIPKILEFQPVGLEGIDKELPKYMHLNHVHEKFLPLLPEGNGWLLVEFGGSTAEELRQPVNDLTEFLKKQPAPPVVKVYDDEKTQKELWEVREAGLGATVFDSKKNLTWPGWEDSAVPPDKVGEYLKELNDLIHRYGYEASLYGHFGQGCIHCSINFDLQSEEGIHQYKRFTEDATHLVVKFGGSISGEHGDGQAKAELLEIMYGPELVEAFRKFKYIWDPAGKMNPGKIVDSYGQLRDLKLMSGYPHNERETFFQYPDDRGKFSNAILRCFGVGKCRQDAEGTMCPSYMVTHEEKHTTRGRARMLFEMMQGDVMNAWKSHEVKESLDLCLSCKGCKGDCPVRVDMATYKSEFLSHYYQGKIRPISAYAFGMIHKWAKMASAMPGAANFFTHGPVFGGLMKWIAGIAPKRDLPKFSRYTFRDWFAKRHRGYPAGRQKVFLWVDTFNNYFTPEPLVAAVQVLEAAGCEVMTSSRHLCCGRPLYDYGMLKAAKQLLVEIMESLGEVIAQEIPVVGLEPSCVSVLRDELRNLFPRDDRAKRLQAQTYTLAEFLNNWLPHYRPPHIDRRLLLHGHCHHKAIMRIDADIDLLKKTGAELDLPDTGCCGMAGGFGYEKGAHYDVSIAVGERVLLPAVRSSSAETLILADGFSCREQIVQQTGRSALHLAQILHMGLQPTEPG